MSLIVFVKRTLDPKVIRHLNATRAWLRETQSKKSSAEVRLLVADVRAWATTWLQKAEHRAKKPRVKGRKGVRR